MLRLDTAPGTEIWEVGVNLPNQPGFMWCWDQFFNTKEETEEACTAMEIGKSSYHWRLT